MRRFFFIIFTVTLTAFPSKMFSQGGRVYTTLDNLSSSYITQIYQDSYGYIWISTEYGLNRFDGIHFNTYNHDRSNPNSIKNNYVRTILEDKNKTLIIGCHNGLMRYDRAGDSFIDIPMIRDGKELIPYVSQICNLSNGDVWIVTAGQGIFSLSKDYSKATYINSFMDKIGFHFYNSIFQDRNNNIWLGTEYNGLVKYNQKRDEIRVYNKPEINSSSIFSINQDKRGAIFIGHRRDGVMKYNSSEDKFEQINSASDNDKINVHCIENVGGELLVGTDGAGVKIYNPNTNLLYDYSLDYSYSDYHKSKAHAILQDRDKNIWIGLYQKGLFFVPQDKKQFQYYGYRSSTHNIIGDNCVLSILKREDGSLYVGTDKDGLYIINQNGSLLKHFAPNSSVNYFPKSIYSMVADNRGNLSVGTAFRGLAKVDVNSGRVMTFKELDGIQVNTIVQVKNELYIGTQGSGLYTLNLDNNLILRCERFNNSVDDELPNKWISTLFYDSHGLLWIGHSKGL